MTSVLLQKPNSQVRCSPALPQAQVLTVDGREESSQLCLLLFHAIIQTTQVLEIPCLLLSRNKGWSRYQQSWKSWTEKTVKLIWLKQNAKWDEKLQVWRQQLGLETTLIWHAGAIGRGLALYTTAPVSTLLLLKQYIFIKSLEHQKKLCPPSLWHTFQHLPLLLLLKLARPVLCWNELSCCLQNLHPTWALTGISAFPLLT